MGGGGATHTAGAVDGVTMIQGGGAGAPAAGAGAGGQVGLGGDGGQGGAVGKGKPADVKADGGVPTDDALAVRDLQHPQNALQKRLPQHQCTPRPTLALVLLSGLFCLFFFVQDVGLDLAAEERAMSLAAQKRRKLAALRKCRFGRKTS